jgi:flagellar biosynthesis component FlhA
MVEQEGDEGKARDPGEAVEILDDALRFHLDKLVEPGMATDFGIEHAGAPDQWMPLVRLLLSEQTTVAATEPLIEAVKALNDKEAPVTVIEAARQYRLNKFVRPSLWGRRKKHIALEELVPGAERELEERLQGVFRDAGERAWAPKALAEKIRDAVAPRAAQGQIFVNPGFAPNTAAANSAKTGENVSVEKAPEVKLDVAVVVERPELRPWVRLLIRQSLPDTPVLSREELSP